MKLRYFLSRCSKTLHKYIFLTPISISFGGQVVRVLYLHPYDTGSNPTVGRFFFFVFFFFFFFFFFCLSRIRDTRPVLTKFDYDI